MGSRREKADNQEPQPTRAEAKINDIDTEALFNTIDAVKADPSKGSCKFFANTEWQHGTVSATRISRYRLGGQEILQNYTIEADEPHDLLGTDTAPNPQMLLYAALNSCVLNTFVVNASAKGIRLDSVKLELEGELDLRGFLAIDASINPGYNELTLVCKVKGNGTKQQYAECLEAGTKYSPNFQSITKGVPIHYRLDAQ